MASPILFPQSHAPGKDAVEGAGSLVNAYAEPLQEGGPSGHVIRRVPGLTQFAETSRSGYRGIWFDGSDNLYAAYATTLSVFDLAGSETSIGSIPTNGVAYTGRFGSTSDTNSYTIGSVDFGEADSERRIVVGIAAMEYEGSELVTNGTFTSNLSGWTASSGMWAQDSGKAEVQAVVFGSELVTNGTFNSSLTGWTNSSGAWTWVSAYAQRSTAPGSLTQSITTTNGATYRIQFTPVSGGSGSITVKFGGSTIGTVAVTAGTQTFNVVASGTSNTLEFSHSGLLGGGIDSVSVKQAYPVPSTLDQAVTTSASASYRIRVTAASAAGSGIGVYWGGVLIDTITANGTYVYNKTASSSSTQLRFSVSSAAGMTIDDVSVKRVQFALPTAVTINSVSATAVASATRAALWVANVPSDASGDVELTYANTMNEAYIAVWRLGGVTSDTPTDTAATTASPGFADLTVAAGGAACFITQQADAITWTLDGVESDMNATINSSVGGTNRHSAFSGFAAEAGTISIASNSATASIAAAVWQGDLTALGSGFVTFAKDNASTPNQVFCAAGAGAAAFTSSSVGSAVDVNSEVVNSVCYGEGYFFYTTPGGLCYASNLNSTTVTATDYTRAEARAEPLVRGIYYRGELFLFGETHTEIYASNGNPNATGFPLNYTTSIWRGLIGVAAIAGFEEGFEGQLIWVADDNSVRQLAGYDPVTISTPDLERDIEACGSKSRIRCWVYDIDGHACVGVHLPGTATWVYDLSTGFWHSRKSLDAADCRLSGNTVRAFDKWIGGDTDSGDLLYLDDSVYTEVGDAMEFDVESIAMEAFPTRLQVSRADFNFVGGVGTTATPDPMVKISWSDDGGHTWSDPVSRKLGEAGRYLEQVRVNRVGLTKHKGRRWRLQVSDQVYVGLLGGSMEVSGRP